MMNQKGFIGVAILLIAVLALGGGGAGYYIYKKQNTTVVSPAASVSQTTTTNLETTTETQPKIPTNEPEKTITASTAVKAVVAVAVKQEPKKVALTFEDHLSACTKFKTTFVHPFTKQTLQKEIMGIIDGKCLYVEQMPGGGKMECRYTESERKAVAQYYKDVAAAQSAGTK
jgi:hypothetical protein